MVEGTVRMNGPDLILQFLNHMNGAVYTVLFKKTVYVKWLMVSYCKNILRNKR